MSTYTEPVYSLPVEWPLDVPRLKSEDLTTFISSLPIFLVEMLMAEEIYIAGGAILSSITGAKTNDYDIFSADGALSSGIANKFKNSIIGGYSITTDNALTIKSVNMVDIQFITKWVFNSPEDCLNSFDYSICRAVVWYDRQLQEWQSCIDPNFYTDVEKKVLRYMRPIREEAAPGSLLRAFKYAMKGYKPTKDSIAAVVARMVSKSDLKVTDEFSLRAYSEIGMAEYFRDMMDASCGRGNY